MLNWQILAAKFNDFRGQTWDHSSVHTRLPLSYALQRIVVYLDKNKPMAEFPVIVENTLSQVVSN